MTISARSSAIARVQAGHLVAIVHASWTHDAGLTVVSPDQVLVLGVAADMGRCQYDGCGEVINVLRTGKLCNEHKQLIAKFQPPSVPGMQVFGRSKVRKVTAAGAPMTCKQRGAVACGSVERLACCEQTSV